MFTREMTFFFSKQLSENKKILQSVKRQKKKKNKQKQF